MHDEDDIRLLFAARGVRWTRQRGAVYAALTTSRSHPTAEELLGQIRDDEEPLSLATVYNTLDTLSEAGLCRRIAVSTAGSTAARFCSEHAPHVHVTTPDGKVMDVPMDLSRQLIAAIPSEVLREVERTLGLRISGVQIQLTGQMTR